MYKLAQGGYVKRMGTRAEADFAVSDVLKVLGLRWAGRDAWTRQSRADEPTVKRGVVDQSGAPMNQFEYD